MTNRSLKPLAVTFQHSELMGRLIRSEGWAEQGISSLRVAREALAGESLESAVQAVENHIFEVRFITESYIPWLRYYVTDTCHRFGAAETWRILAAVSSHLAATGFPPLATQVISAATGEGGPFTCGDGNLSFADQTLTVASWAEIFEGALVPLREALVGGHRDEARELLDAWHLAGKPVHDGYTEWTWLWMTLVADAHGEAVMFEQLKAVGELLRGQSLRRQAALPIEELVLQMAMAMRGHRCGPGEEGDVEIVEDEEKYLMWFDACGSGGRMRRKGELDGLPARQDPPYNFGVVKEPVDASWNMAGVPYYCTHCALWSEVMTTDIIGYPARITLFNPDGNRPCGWAIYKRPEDIPQEYFDRIGRERRPERFNKLTDDLAKPIEQA